MPTKSKPKAGGLSKKQLQHMEKRLLEERARVIKELGHYDDPDQHRAGRPILIAQGTADNDVPEGATDGLASRLCTLGDRLEYRLFPGLDHNNLVAGSLSLVGSWITARLDNHVASTTCKTKP